MAVMLGPFQVQKTSFDFDYWLLLMHSPHELGIFLIHRAYRLHYTITSRDRLLVALEATKLLAKHLKPMAIGCIITH